MHEKQVGGSSQIIQGVEVQLPKKPTKENILFNHLPKKDQHWHRTPLPIFRVMDIKYFSDDMPEDFNEEIDWESARREEIIAQTGCDPIDLDRQGNPKIVKGVIPNPDYYCEALENFREQEYDRIYNGVWFYNNGAPTYITGHYYFFLNWWKMDVGYGTYRNPDRELYYLNEYVKQSPTDFGILEITGRGTGKSSRAGEVSYLETITKRNAYGGIQSKTDDDAKDFFLEKIVEPYKDLPDFLIPVNKNSSSPTRELNFSPPSRGGKNAMVYRKNDKEALRSILDFRNSQETAYDGKTLSFLLQDEIGKTLTANVYTRWEVNRQCLYRDGKKRGWSLLTTTVEEMENKGGENCKELWDNSNQLERNENGRTVSWCIRYFRPASQSRNFDKYGFPDTKKNLREHDIEKETLRNDPSKYISYIQKNPESIEEAFAMSSGNSPYNVAILQQSQIRVISSARPLVRVGDFQWDKGVRDTKVIFVDNPENGMWYISWMDMKQNESNIVIEDGEIIGINGENVKQWICKKNGKRYGGYDPYSAKKTVFQNKRSDAAAAIYQKYHDPLNIGEDYLDTYIADFAGRYPNPDDAHEQIIMSAVFFGVDYLVENNKLGAIEYICKRGWSSILMDRPSATGTKNNYNGYIGLPSNQNTIDFYVGETRSDININGHKNKHLRIIQDFLSFDPMKTTKFDSAVGASLAVVAAKSEVEIDDELSKDIGDFFRTTDQSGSLGKIN